MKICVRCKEEKDLEEFYVNNSLHDKLTIYCKICIKGAEGDYYRRNPDIKKIRSRRLKLLKNGGELLTNEMYFSMLSSQEHKCGICKD